MHLRKAQILFLVALALVAISAIGGGFYWDAACSSSF